MAHYAFLDDNNKVTLVIVGKDENEDGVDWEKRYEETHGQVCKRTSYSTHANIHARGGVPFRKNYAAVGFSYDPERDAFIPPKPPYASWLLDEDTCVWKAPIPIPEDGVPFDGQKYFWSEKRFNWIACDWDEQIGDWVEKGTNIVWDGE